MAGVVKLWDDSALRTQTAWERLPSPGGEELGHQDIPVVQVTSIHPEGVKVACFALTFMTSGF